MAQEPFFDPSRYDINKPLLDRDAIRRFNQQRYEMELLDGVLFRDDEAKLIGGFLHLRRDSWWARGHFPGHPMLPGVLSFEAAGQLCSIYYHGLSSGLRMGLAKIEEARLLRPMEPPGILFLAGRLKSQRSRFALFETQGILNGEVVSYAAFTGAAL